MWGALVIAILLPAFSFAYMFKSIQKKDGLLGVKVNAILKDSRGYMWFGTESGLTRFDGYQKKNFSSENEALSDASIESIQEDANGDLWIKTLSGYVIYNPCYESFNQDLHQRLSKLGIDGMPSIIYIDSRKNFWTFVPGKGCTLVKGGSDLKYTFTFDANDETAIPEGTVSCISETPYGAVLTYTNGTIVGIDITRGAVVWKNRNFSKIYGLESLTAIKSMCDKNGNIWLYSNSFVTIYNHSNGKWTTISELASAWGAEAPMLQDNPVKEIAQDQSGVVWIGTVRGGLYKVNMNARTIEPIRSNGNADRSLPSNSVSDIYIDNTGLLWVGTDNGVAYLGGNLYRFGVEKLGSVTSICEAKDGSVWLGTSDRGLISRKNVEISYLNRANSSISSDNISALFLARNGALWVGSAQNGLDCLNGEKVTHFGKAGKYSIGSDNVSDICQDASGNIWVATRDAGLRCINVMTGSITPYNVRERNISSDNVTSVICNRKNQIVAGTADGVTIVDLNSHNIKVYRGTDGGATPLSNTNVSQVAEDSRGYLWVATHDGLNVFSPDMKKLRVLNTHNGLASNMVRAVAIDRSHNVWVTTSAGISKIGVKGKEFAKLSLAVSNYDESDGVISGDFNSRSICVTKNGHILFGGTTGLNTVLSSIKESGVESTTRVFFTQLYIHGDEVTVGRSYSGNVVLPEALSEIGTIKLKNSQNTFSVKFASSNYNVSERPRFIYWLEGRDSEWNYANSALHGVNIRHLSSGTYKLHVKAIDNFGKTSPESVLTIEIMRPFWLSWWAIGFYILIIVFPFVWWRRIRPRVHRRELVQLRQVDEANMKQEALEEVSDELRRPVTNMIPSLTTMIDEETNESKKEELENVHNEALKMLSMLNSLKETFEQKGDKVSLEDVNRLTEKIRAEQLSTEEEYVEDEASDEGNTGSRASKNNVFVVDDNEDFIAYLSGQLYMHYNVEGSTMVQEALELIDNQKPDIVLYKSRMKGLSGKEFCTRLRNNPETENIKVIEITENQATIDIESNEKAAIADDYLSKPFTIKVLIERINRQLGIETHALVRRRGRGGNTTPAVLDEELFVNAEKYVLENLSNTNLSVDMLAKAMNMSRGHLYKRLLAITGKTPVEFIRYIRIRQSAQMLRNTNDNNVSEIAYAVGFNSPKYFSNYFKEEYGMLPSIYQSKYRNRQHQQE